MISTRRLTRDEWDAAAPLFRDLSYCQCSSYAEAAAGDVGAETEFVAVYRAAELIGLANVRVKRLPFSPFGVAYVSHGPLTARGEGFSAELFGHCLDALRREYVEVRRLVLRIVPPLRGGLWREAQLRCLEMRNFQPAGWWEENTFILDLAKPLSEIRKDFNGKWRGHLSKAQRSNIEVTRSAALEDFDRFEPLFLGLVQEKGFSVAQDVCFFRRVQSRAQPYEQLVAHLAWHDGELVAGHIGSFAGDTAVYLLGASTSKGREIRASYLLQWAVIEYAKSVGNCYYDLGGVDQQANPKVYEFKQRLNGRLVTKAGAYELASNRLLSRFLHILEGAHKKGRLLHKRWLLQKGSASRQTANADF
jgi:lipid II:glycine glycyltransferase (peptidoglycan interpeptide bridge formation enzyme)